MNDRPYTRYIFSKAYLQMADNMPADQIIVLKFLKIKISYRVCSHRAVFSVFCFFIPMHIIFLEKLLELPRIFVSKPAKISHRETAILQKLLPSVA